MIENILLDLDGTLIDSSPGIGRAIEYAMEQEGLILPQEAVTDFIGPPLALSFQKYTGDPQTVDALIRAFRVYYSQKGVYEHRLYPGVREMLAALSQKRKLYLATAKPLNFAGRIIEQNGLKRYFSGLYGPDEDDDITGKTQVMVSLVEKEKCDPKKTLMVGDRAHDVLAAAAVGIRTVGVLYGFGTEDELKKAGAVATISTPSALVSFVEHTIL